MCQVILFHKGYYYYYLLHHKNIKMMDMITVSFIRECVCINLAHPEAEHCSMTGLYAAATTR